MKTTEGSPSDSDSPCVLDSSSLVAYLEGKPQGSVIQRILWQARDCKSKVFISAMDMLTVYLKGITDHPESFADLLALLDQLPIHVEPVTARAALEAAKLIAANPDIKPSAAVSADLVKSVGGTLVSSEQAISSSNLLPKDSLLYIGDETFSEKSPD